MGRTNDLGFGLPTGFNPGRVRRRDDDLDRRVGSRAHSGSIEAQARDELEGVNHEAEDVDAHTHVLVDTLGAFLRPGL